MIYLVVQTQVAARATPCTISNRVLDRDKMSLRGAS
jgi:hypothetical protein